jgi:hypothetical protein
MCFYGTELRKNTSYLIAMFESRVGPDCMNALFSLILKMKLYLNFLTLTKEFLFLLYLCLFACGFKKSKEKPIFVQREISFKYCQHIKNFQSCNDKVR